MQPIKIDDRITDEAMHLFKERSPSLAIIGAGGAGVVAVEEARRVEREKAREKARKMHEAVLFLLAGSKVVLPRHVAEALIEQTGKGEIEEFDMPTGADYQMISSDEMVDESHAARLAALVEEASKLDEVVSDPKQPRNRAERRGQKPKSWERRRLRGGFK